MSQVYSLPPGLRQPAAIYESGTLSTVDVFGEQKGRYAIDDRHGDLLNDWLADLRRRFNISAVPSALNVQNLEPAIPLVDSRAALRRILERTWWSLRRASDFFGCSHAQIRRVREGQSNPRYDFAQQIADADILTRTLYPVAGSDAATLNRMLFSTPIDGARETAADAFKRGDVYHAMVLARRVLYPRSTGMINVPQSPFNKYDAANAYLDE